MKYIAAYALLVLGGNESPSADDVSKVLKSVGIDAEKDRLDLLINNLKGKKLHELIAAGSSKLSTLSAGSGSAASAGPAKTEAAAPVKEEEPQEEEADVNVANIFDQVDDY